MALVVVTATATATVSACGTDRPVASAPGPGAARAAFPDPGELPFISTTTTHPPPDGVDTAVGVAGGTGSPTTFRGVPARPPRSTTTSGPGTGDGGRGRSFEASAVLSGAEAVPPPGDPRGTGSARVRPVGDGLCVDLEVRSLFADPTGAHLHRGVRGATGDVVATLRTPADDGTANTCVDVDQAIVDAIAADPAGFYVDVHTATHPDGAIRGQLAAA